MTILHYAYGDLKLIINELDVEALTAEDGGQRVYDHIKEAYGEHLDKKLPKAIERALFSNEGKRNKGESMIQYVSRKKMLFNELDRAKCVLPPTAKGYIMLRDAQLSDRAWDTIETWTTGSYELSDIATYLRKLERPIPGKTHSHLTGLSGFVGDDEDRYEEEGPFLAYADQEDPSQVGVFMTESLFVLPDEFEGLDLDEALRHVDDLEVLYVAHDLADDVILTENEAVAIYANYGEVRKYLHKKQLSRGFTKFGQKGGKKGHKSSSPSSTYGGKGGFNKTNRRPPPKKWTKKHLMDRSKCARCGKIGHWARECTNPPDERGKRRMGTVGFMQAQTAKESVTCLSCSDVPALAEEPDDVVDGFVFFTSYIFPSSTDVSSFIGLCVCPGYALIDTGAQHGVMGPQTYDQICEVLARSGLQPRIVPTLELQAAGVGGVTKFRRSAEIPVAIKGFCGIITGHVIDQNVPFLLPVEFCKKLGMILNMPDQQVHWKYINRISDVTELDQSGHLAIEIFEFPKDGWKCPHQTKRSSSIITGTDASVNSTLTRSLYEIPQPFACSSTVAQRTGTCTTSTHADDVGGEGLENLSGSVVVESPGAGKEPDRKADPRTAHSTMEDHHHQTPHGAPNVRLEEDGINASRSRSVPSDLQHCPPDGSRSADRQSDHQRRVGGKATSTGRRTSEDVTRAVPAPGLQHEGASEQDLVQMVDMCKLSDTLGEEASRGCRPEGRRGADGERSTGFRQVRRQDLQGGVRLAEAVLPVGSYDGGSRGGKLPSVEAVRQVHCDDRVPRGDRSDGSDRKHNPDSGALSEHPQQSQRGGFHNGGRRPVNRLIAGPALRHMFPVLSLPLVGYIGQLVTDMTKHRDLEGPVFGNRVGIYVSDSPDGPWKNGSIDSDMNSAGASNNSSPADEWRLILYQTTDGAHQGSTEDCEEIVSTTPRPAVQEITRRIVEPEETKNQTSSSVYPMESIPEDQEVQQELPAQELPEERVGEDPNAAPDSDEEEAPPPPDFQPSPDQLRDLHIAHDNSGHPTNADFARLLRRGNCKPEIAAWVRKNFKCEQCEAETRPRARRPTAVPRSYRFNHVVGVDLIEPKGLSGQTEHWINCVCWGTGFQLVARLGGNGHKSAENTWNAFVRCWARIFGMPEVMVVDPGLEFQGYFAEMSASYGISILPTDARAPWQNGRTERAGKEWKRQFKIARRKEEPLNDEEWVALGELVCGARNRYNNRSGYSPMQRVFGFSTRLPASLQSDDIIDPQYLSEDPLDDFKRAEELRQAAVRAWAAMDNRSRLLKSLRARHRTLQTFVEGQLVFVWRQTRVGQGRWHGPGVVVLPTVGGAWVNMRGSLWRVSNEQLRSATSEESAGTELVNRYLASMKEDLRKKRGARRYVDVRSEGPPRFPGDPPVQDPEDLRHDDHREDFLSDSDEEGEPAQPEPEAPGRARERGDEDDTPRRVRSRLQSSIVSEPAREPAASSGSATPGAVTPPVAPVLASPRTERAAPYPYPYPLRGLQSDHLFVESIVDETLPGLQGIVVDNSGEDPEFFGADEAEAEFSTSLLIFYIRKKRPGEEIKVSKLSAAAQKLFLGPGGSRVKEWKSITGPREDGSFAVKIHRGKDAQKIRRESPDRIIPSRWHEKWKDMGDEFDNALLDPEVPAHMGAKSRWIIQGFHDPDIAILNRTVPTPATSDVPLALQMLASIQARAFVGDVKSAFTQGLQGQREQVLYASPPVDGIPGENEDILIELLAEIYGLITGPPAWRKTLISVLRELEFKRHPLAPCVAIMYEEVGGKPEQFSGLIVIETDDVLGGGIGSKFHNATDQLRRRFKFGVWVELMEHAREYGGRTLYQHKNYDITISMVRYLRERAREIVLERGRCKTPDELATEDEISSMRGLMGKVNWATREGMPNGSGDASLLSGTLPYPRVKDLQEANAALRRLLQANVTITIKAIPLSRLRILLFSDSSLGNAGGGGTQIAFMTCGVDASILEGVEADVSPLTYHSHKMARAGSSTLLAEANGLSEGLADAEWVASWIGLVKDLHYDLRKRSTLNREFKITSILTQKDTDLNLAAVVDAKSLYDNASREQYSGAEKRAALEICVIRDSLESLGGQPRWVPHEENPVDCMTKMKGNTLRMLDLLKTGRYKLVMEEEELARRKEYREATGQRNPRPMVTTARPSSKPPTRRSPSTTTSLFTSYCHFNINVSVAFGSPSSVSSTSPQENDTFVPTCQCTFLTLPNFRNMESTLDKSMLQKTSEPFQVAMAAAVAEGVEPDVDKINALLQSGVEAGHDKMPPDSQEYQEYHRTLQAKQVLVAQQQGLLKWAQENPSTSQLMSSKQPTPKAFAEDAAVPISEKGPNRTKIPPHLHRLFRFLELRDIQRARVAEIQCGGARHSWGDWKRLHYSRVRHKEFFFLKRARFAQMQKDYENRLTNVEADYGDDQHDEPPPPEWVEPTSSSAPLIPKRQRRAWTETGKAYLRRKRLGQRERKQAKKAAAKLKAKEEEEEQDDDEVKEEESSDAPYEDGEEDVAPHIIDLIAKEEEMKEAYPWRHDRPIRPKKEHDVDAPDMPLEAESKEVVKDEVILERDEYDDFDTSSLIVDPTQPASLDLPDEEHLDDSIHEAGMEYGFGLVREGPVPGQDEKLEDVTPIALTKIGIFPSVHWSEGTLVAKNQKHVWNSIVYRELYNGQDGLHVNVDDVKLVLFNSGCPMDMIQSIAEAAPLDGLPPTPGKWFYCKLNEEHLVENMLMNHYMAPGPEPELTGVYHGTAMPNLAEILTHGLLEGPSETDHKAGVYCEGCPRQSNCLNYMTHIAIPGSYPMYMWAVLLECLADRSRGGTVHKQFYQPKGSITVCAVAVHCFNLKDAFQPGFAGWYRVYAPCLKALTFIETPMDYKQWWDRHVECRNVEKRLLAIARERSSSSGAAAGSSAASSSGAR